MSSPPQPPPAPQAPPGWPPAPAGPPSWFAARPGARPGPPPAGAAPFPFIPVQQSAPPAGLEGPLGPHPWAPPAKRSRAWLFVVAGLAGVLALLTVAGVALAVLMPGPAAPAPAPASAAAPAAEQSPAVAIGRWYRGGGRQILDDLSRDFQRAGAAASVADLRTACTAIQRDVRAAQTYAPIPDAEAHRHFATALAQYARAADNCLAGINGADPALIHQAGGQLAAGTESLSASSRRIVTLAGG